MKAKIRHFMKAVTAAGTRERLTSSEMDAPAVMIQAESTNTGKIYVGDNQVSSTSYGADLAASDSVTFRAEDLGMANVKISLDDIWLDTSVSTDGVSVIYLERIE